MRIDLSSPTNWTELTGQQLVGVCSLLQGGLSREELLVAAFCLLCNVKIVKRDETYWLQRDGKETPISILAIGDFSSRFGWVIDDEPTETACPFDIDRHLIDTTFEHYFRADTMMLYYWQTDDRQWLTKALAELGAPRDNLTEAEELATRIWWNSFKDWLMCRYPLVFATKSGSSEPYNPIDARQNIMLMLNDGHPQDNERIEQSNMHDVFAAIQHKIEQANEAQRILKKR